MIHIRKFNENEILEPRWLFEGGTIDFQKNQPLMSIRSKGQEIGYVEIEDGKIVTSGRIGDNKYDNFVQLIHGLQGFDIKIDDFYF